MLRRVLSALREGRSRPGAGDEDASGSTLGAGPRMQRTRSPATRGVCLVTMARNETEVLTHWAWHYCRLLEAPKFVVLDDASEPGMLETVRSRVPQADIDVIRLPEGPFSDQYKSNALSALATVMVERYATVIATDADEIVAPIGPHRGRPFEDLLREVPHPFAAPIGIAPIHDIAGEEPFDPLRPIAAQRSVGMLKAVSTKPAIWQGEAWVFSPGQHALRQRRVPVTTALGLVHLKFVDADLLAARQTVRHSREMSGAQGPHLARHWRRDPAAIRGMQVFRDAAKLRTGPRLLDEIPGFLDREFDRAEGAHVIRNLNGERRGSLDGLL
ncbi:hypothetical protein HKCCSP123_03620 [Rhodobacterales bacterium HKCCSP123]|nr:hypothetical protein [Rhodobacterales bacterium HKCCSP123]